MRIFTAMVSGGLVGGGKSTAMTIPAFFESDTRRREYAWRDWPAVSAFLARQAVCRIAVNDGRFPYIVAQTFRFDGEAFLLHVSRSGKLTAALRTDPHCTIEVSHAISFARSERDETVQVEYQSVVARCVAEVSELDLVPDASGSPRRIAAVRARVITLSAKQRLVNERTSP